MKSLVCFVLGTRPEIIKISPLIKYAEKNSIPFFIIHTGQHYSYEMDKLMFEELELQAPKYNLEVGSGSHGLQTAKMIEKIEEILILEKPDYVFVQGDTNSVLAGALAAVKLKIKIGHIEAGLRSYDRNMPEEINRIIVDHISDFLFVPTSNSEKNLLGEGIPNEKIVITGNTIVDSVIQNYELAKKKSKILDKLSLKSKHYFLLTLHRAENVDDLSKLKNILNSIKSVFENYHHKVVWPIHPRTKARLQEFNLLESVENDKNIILTDSLGFLDSIFLQKNAKLVLTDSGGIQEESCILGVPCVTLRENTERPESVEVGANIIAGTDTDSILKAVENMYAKERNWKNPFGDGKSSDKIFEAIEA